MHITKKELLEVTGISYGQLYRWKREGLIPEAWFIKQSSYTGQETIFPREKVLARIEAIQRLKDQYSLEEVAAMLSPEVSERLFAGEDLPKITEIEPALAAHIAREQQYFSYMQVLMLCAVSQFWREQLVAADRLPELYEGIQEVLQQVKQTEFILLLLRSDGMHYLALCPEQHPPYLDKRLSVVGRVRMDDLSAQIRVKYRKRFQFFDEGDN